MAAPLRHRGSAPLASAERQTATKPLWNAANFRDSWGTLEKMTKKFDMTVLSRTVL